MTRSTSGPSPKPVWLPATDRPACAAGAAASDNPRPTVQWAVFERRLDLSRSADFAIVNLFAVHRYRLIVNDQVVGNGPARFLRGLERFDSHDLRPFLRVGINRIVVECAFLDANNFQHAPDDTPRFVAWGSIRSNLDQVDLATPGAWRASAGSQWLDPTPCFSFAIGPVEIRDLRIEQALGTTPLVVNGIVPDAPRDIPSPSGRLVIPRCLHATPVLDDVQRIGFVSVHPTSRSSHQQPTRGSFFRYATFLHSPREQQATLGLHWGAHFLNGQPLQPENDSLRGNRQNAVATFRPGWNLLCGEVEQLQPIHPFLLDWPVVAGLLARSRPDRDDPGQLRFEAARNIPDGQRWKERAPADADALQLESPDWQVVPRDVLPPVPARMMSWDVPDPRHRLVRPTLPLHAPDGSSCWTCVFDFGTEFLGHVIVELECPDGTVLDIGYDERLRSDGALDWFASNPFVESADRFVLPAGHHRIETFHPRGGRYLQLALRTPDGLPPATLHAVQLRDARCVPVFDHADAFCSDNELLQWTWQSGLDTLRASIEDVHCDSPWRERGAYLGDSYVQSMVELHVTSDRRIIRRTMRLFAAGQRDDGQLPCVVPAWYRDPHGDFTLIYALWLHDYWLATGEDDIVRECLPAVDRLLASPGWQTSSRSCLWDAPPHVRLFIDWGALPLARTCDENGVLNALRCRALRCAASMHRALGNDDRAATLDADAARVADDYRRRLWLDAPGRFAIGTQDGIPVEREVIHGNILALAFRLADEQQEPRLAEYVVRRLRGNADHALRAVPADDFAELYFLKFALDALERIGRHEEAMRVIVDHMAPMHRAGAPTFWECLHRGIAGKGSLCHSWSTAPLEYLARQGRR